MADSSFSDAITSFFLFAAGQRCRQATAEAEWGRAAPIAAELRREVGRDWPPSSRQWRRAPPPLRAANPKSASRAAAAPDQCLFSSTGSTRGAYPHPRLLA